MALEVHMTCTGNQERSDELQAADVATLRLAVETWEPPALARYAEFDNKVLALIMSALSEAENHGFAGLAGLQTETE